MTEFAINFLNENSDIVKKFYNSIKIKFGNRNVVITCYQTGEYCQVLLACEDLDSKIIKYDLEDMLVDVIVVYFKQKFIEKYLCIPIKNHIGYLALKKALISFDKDTDIHIVKKYLMFNNTIYMESFFDFILISLKNKWFELVKLANDNGNYLVCDDTFVELLKFLVENLEVECEEINLICNNNELKICDNTFNEIKNTEKAQQDIEEFIIEKIISLCPKYINIYCENFDEKDSLKFICKIFENRTRVLSLSKIKGYNLFI